MTIEELFVERFKKLEKKIDERHKEYEELAQHCEALENRITKYKKFVKFIEDNLDINDGEDRTWLYIRRFLKKDEIELLKEVGISFEKKEESTENE